MNRLVNRCLASLVLIVLLTGASCPADVEPAAVNTDLGPGFPVTDLGSLRERCLAKQKARLAECEDADQAGRDACLAAAETLVGACADLPTGPSGVSESENGWFCDGECETVACTARNPCNLGKDADGDGKNDRCIDGFICKPEVDGEICDEGILIDCACATYYYPPNGLRTVPICQCFCD